MDKQTQFDEVLNALRAILPKDVQETCASLNGHGEWELALGYCIYHLSQIPLPISSEVKANLEACALQFRAGDKSLQTARSLLIG